MPKTLCTAAHAYLLRLKRVKGKEEEEKERAKLRWWRFLCNLLLFLLRQRGKEEEGPPLMRLFMLVMMMYSESTQVGSGGTMAGDQQISRQPRPPFFFKQQFLIFKEKKLQSEQELFFFPLQVEMASAFLFLNPETRLTRLPPIFLPPLGVISQAGRTQWEEMMNFQLNPPPPPPSTTRARRQCTLPLSLSLSPSHDSPEVCAQRKEAGGLLFCHPWLLPSGLLRQINPHFCFCAERQQQKSNFQSIFAIKQKCILYHKLNFKGKPDADYVRTYVPIDL